MEEMQEQRIFLCLTVSVDALRAGLQLQDNDRVARQQHNVDPFFLARNRKLEQNNPVRRQFILRNHFFQC